MGLGSTIAGAAFGIRAISLNNKVNAACPDVECDQPDLEGTLNSAKQSATLSSIFFGVGITGLAVGTYLVLSAPKDSLSDSSSLPQTETARASLDVVPLQGGAAFTLAGQF